MDIMYDPVIRLYVYTIFFVFCVVVTVALIAFFLPIKPKVKCHNCGQWVVPIYDKEYGGSLVQKCECGACLGRTPLL